MPNPLFEKFLKIKEIKEIHMYIGVRYVPFSVIHQNRCQFCNIIKKVIISHQEGVILNNKLAFEWEQIKREQK